MTKPREPLTFALAITTICGRIGWKEAARIADRSERTIRYWSESDHTPTASIQQAIDLDRAYLEAGGSEAPILESYARQLDIHLAQLLPDRAAFAAELANATLETAQAISSSISAMNGNAGPSHIHHAIRETEEAGTAIQRLLARLRSFLPGVHAPGHPLRSDERGN